MSICICLGKEPEEVCPAHHCANCETMRRQIRKLATQIEELEEALSEAEYNADIY